MRWASIGLLLLATSTAYGEECKGSVYSIHDKDQNGTKTSSGIPLDDAKPTMAHRLHVLRGWMRITNLRTGKVTDLQVTDRGPFVPGRCADFSVAAAKKVGCDGLCEVRVEPWSEK